MDQIKIGKFIQETRKEKNLTQKELAERLDVSDKAVSKWETGNGLPEVSLMLPLCEILEISVNELLSGERLDERHYQEKAEENIVHLISEKEEAKKKLALSIAAGCSSVLSGVTLFLLAGLLPMAVWLRVLVVAIGVVVTGAGIGVACVLDRDAGAYECPCCGHRFVPTMKEYVMGPHTMLKRKLRCPGCGKKSYCRKRLTK